MWGTQLGKTVMMPGLVAWAASNDPGPALIATSNKDSAQIMEREKIYPVLEDCRETRGMLLPDHKRVFSRVDLRDMICFMAWSGSATELGEKSIRYLFLSELDKWATEQSREADTEQLACERTKAWPNKKVYKEGTPTLEGQSRIEHNLKNADVVLKYHVPCPHCGVYQVLKSAQIKWERDEKGKSTIKLARKTAHYQCEYCRGFIEDYDRGRMLRRGIWAPEGHETPPDTDYDRYPVLWGQRDVPTTVGTQLSSLYSPSLTWGEMAEAFLSCGNDPRKLQNWRNSWEALPWAPEVELTSWSRVRDRLATPCPRGTVPAWAVALTAGADIGKRELHYVIRAWAKDERSQLVEEGCIEVDYVNTDLRGAIHGLGYTVCERDFPIESKTGTDTMRVRMLLIDAGWPESALHVYEISNLLGIHRCRAIKGATISTGAHAPWHVTVTDTDPGTGHKLSYGGQRLFMVDSPYWQGWLNGKIRMECKPDEPGAWLLHATPHEDYLRQICNVIVKSKRNTKNRPVFEYVVHNTDIGAHYHDCEYYAAVAADMLGIRRIARQVAIRGGATPEEKSKRIGGRTISRPHGGPGPGPGIDFRQMDFRR